MFLVMDNTVARQVMAENGRKWQEMDFRVFLVVVIEVTRKTIAEMVENRSQVKIDDICQKWQEMDFRVFCVVVIEVARKTIAEMAENGEKGFPRLYGRKWISACFSSWPSR